MFSSRNRENAFCWINFNGRPDKLEDILTASHKIYVPKANHIQNVFVAAHLMENVLSRNAPNLNTKITTVPRFTSVLCKAMQSHQQLWPLRLPTPCPLQRFLSCTFPRFQKRKCGSGRSPCHQEPPPLTRSAPIYMKTGFMPPGLLLGCQLNWMLLLGPSWEAQSLNSYLAVTQGYQHGISFHSFPLVLCVMEAHLRAQSRKTWNRTHLQ